VLRSYDGVCDSCHMDHSITALHARENLTEIGHIHSLECIVLWLNNARVARWIFIDSNHVVTIFKEILDDVLTGFSCRTGYVNSFQSSVLFSNCSMSEGVCLKLEMTTRSLMFSSFGVMLLSLLGVYPGM